MQRRQSDVALADLRDYGFVVDRKRALRELYPPLERVLAEVGARSDPGPQSLKGAA